MENLKSLKDIFEMYKKWVCDNPTLVTDVETALTWTSYGLSGKFNNSAIMSEVIYSLSKVVELFNDQILRDAYNRERRPFDTKEKIKLTLTIINYCEVLYELLIKRGFGEKGKWTGIVTLRVIKSFLQLILLHRFGQFTIPKSPILELHRNDFVKQQNDKKNEAEVSTFSLTSGRFIRHIDGAPGVAFRDWQPVQSLDTCNRNKIRNKTFAEMIHIVKPLVHLGSMYMSGQRSWVPWFTALGLDLTSLGLYSTINDLKLHEKNVIMQRYYNLLFYLLRAPMYDNYTKRAIEVLLAAMAARLPFGKLMREPITHYLNHLLDIYFYMWA